MRQKYKDIVRDAGACWLIGMLIAMAIMPIGVMAVSALEYSATAEWPKWQLDRVLSREGGPMLALWMVGACVLGYTISIREKLETGYYETQ